MATVATALTFARTQGQTDENGLTDEDGLTFANAALLDFRRRLISNGVDAAQLQEAYRDMTAATGTYLYPTNLWWLKAIELNYTDSVGQNYIRAQQVDVSNLPAGVSFGWLRTNASTATPNFDDRGDWYEIFPTPTNSNTAGIKLIYFLQPVEYSSTASTLSYPESIDYRVIGWKILASYQKSIKDYESATQSEKEYNDRVMELIATLGRGTQQPIQAIVPPQTGWEY